MSEIILSTSHPIYSSRTFFPHTQLSWSWTVLFCLITWHFLHSGNIKSLEPLKRALLPSVFSFLNWFNPILSEDSKSHFMCHLLPEAFSNPFPISAPVLYVPPNICSSLQINIGSCRTWEFLKKNIWKYLESFYFSVFGLFRACVNVIKLNE